MGYGVWGADGTIDSCDGSLRIVMPYMIVSGGDRAQALPAVSWPWAVEATSLLGY